MSRPTPKAIALAKQIKARQDESVIRLPENGFPGLLFDTIPPDGDWYMLIRKEIHHYRQSLAKAVGRLSEYRAAEYPCLRFPDEVALDLRKSKSMWERVFAYMDPTKFNGGLPDKMFGCRVLTVHRVEPGEIGYSLSSAKHWSQM